MKIVSTTLAGPDAVKDGIHYAIKSVAPFVDECLIISTDPDHYVDFDHPKAKHCFWMWEQDYSAARNAALLAGLSAGADWVITVDPDERIEPHGEDIRAVIEAADASGANGLLSQDEEETYSKPRALKCTSDVMWIGRVHESIVLISQAELHTFPKMRFSEVPKQGEDLTAKFARDIPLLLKDIADDPKCTRAWYYLGSSYHGVGDLEAAIKAFKECALLNGWYEESAWACYRAARLLESLDRDDEAMECIAAGMRRDGGMGELPALAAVIKSNHGQTEQARCFAETARLHGPGSASFARRMGFRDPTVINVAISKILTDPPAPAML